MRNLVLVALGWMASGFAAATGLPKVAIVVDRVHYEVVEQGGNGFDETFYPRGQGASQWSERLLVRDLGEAGTLTPDQLESVQREEERSRCETLSSQRIENDGAALPVWQWYCPATAPSPTMVQWVKPVVAGGRAYFAQAQFRGPAPAGRIPKIPPASWDRAIEFVSGFEACSQLTRLGCVPPEAVMGAYGDAPVLPDERREADMIAARGLAMHRQDQLAWHATDYVRQHKLFDHERGGGGFLSIPGEGRSGSTYFIALKGDRIARVLRIDTDAKGEISGKQALPDLPVELLPRWRARQMALRHPGLKLCTPTANTLVLPAEDGAGWWVYVMSASSVVDQVFLGGHNRLRIDAEGETVESIEHSARSCLDIDAGKLRAMKRSEGFFLSHLVSPLPWETDVMQSLTYAFPLTRVTDNGVWRIEGDQLRKFALEPTSP